MSVITLKPQTIADIQEIVREQSGLLPRGNGTKPALSTPYGNAKMLDMSAVSGIIEYEPGEYTFTAYAGTPLVEIEAELQEHGQYMPFDPLLVQSGATLGGTIAANTSGSGRYRYGGVRDFILGVRFVDGKGEQVSSGGKVVKNAAGFDLPKFFAGSLGRYGVITEASFKVFPVPPQYKTLHGTFETLSDAIAVIFRLAMSPLEMDALDLLPDSGRWALMIRVGGLESALPGRLERLAHFLDTETTIIDDDTSLWRDANELIWANSKPVVKVPISPRKISDLDTKLSDLLRRYTAGGNVAWVATDDVDTLRGTLTELDLVGLQVTGTTENPYIGQRRGLALAQRVKKALDPDNTFLEA